MALQQYEIDHLKKMKTYAPECMVLLKSDGRFPLENPGKVALYGSGARRTIKGGTGSGDVNSRSYVTVEKGLERAGFTVTTKAWLDAYDEAKEQAYREFVETMKREAREHHTNAIMYAMGMVAPEPASDFPLDGEGDAAIYVLARNSGEGNDRKVLPGDVELTESEINAILACRDKYDRFLLVLNVGGVVDLSPVLCVENILLMSQLGAVGGDAFADVVLGKESPSGKLTTTWGTGEEIDAIREFGDKNDTRYQEGIYVGYRYYDSVCKDPVFPFGYGLSYTEFEIGEAEADVAGCKVSVKVPVKNVGKYAGKEVVQVYVTAPWGDLDHPYQQLAGFAKTKKLAPGECEMVEVSFCMRKQAAFDPAKAAYVLESGDYVIRVGNCSRAVKAVLVAHLAETVVVRQTVNRFGETDFTDWKPEHLWKDELLDGVKRVELDPAALAEVPEEKNSDPSDEAKAFVEMLSDEDLCHLVVGGGQSGEGGFSVIGQASIRVAGAAGETYDGISGVRPVIMADGPAGLRLNKHYFKDKKGVVGMGEALPGGFADFMPKAVNVVLKMMAKKPKGEIYDQYCTAIPIGTALAQTWNPELIENCGDVVGEEMEMFGVHLWLAPAFNIHRSPLCGRNFEYCSEDPVISAMVGAAITKGVQKHPGRGTTIKHFCANNQETNRYGNNSIVSERALRDIYLKPFELCINDSDPAALMTSYNLLNGTHTSEREDLLKGFLREELGWTGLIMTDWVISLIDGGKGKYRIGKAAPTVKAGNDVFMPGSKGDYKQVLEALEGKHREFELTRDEVKYCAARVVDAAWKLCGKE